MSNTRRFGVSLVLALGGMLSSLPEVRASQATFSGNVFSSAAGNPPISGATVTPLCTNANGQEITCPILPGGQASTLGDGSFNFTADTTNCVSGMKLRVSAPGFQTQKVPVNMAGQAGIKVFLNPTLGIVPPPAPPPVATYYCPPYACYYPADSCYYPVYCCYYPPYTCGGCWRGGCGRRCR